MAPTPLETHEPLGLVLFLDTLCAFVGKCRWNPGNFKNHLAVDSLLVKRPVLIRPYLILCPILPPA